MKILKLSTALLVLAFTLPATAGFDGGQTVVIDDTAQGSLNAARASSNSVEFIDCALEVLATGSTVTCTARDSAGTTVTCSTSDPVHVKAVERINQSSLVLFTWDPATPSVCTSVVVNNGSQYLP
jgi:hypothetical protein